MGVNLVPIIPLDSTFKILSRSFSKNNHDDEHNFLDGCIIKEGRHRLLNFEFMCHNIGDEDLVAGSPLSRPDIFTQSEGHEHWHLKDLNQYTLKSKSGNAVFSSMKQSFCLLDMIPLSFPKEEWPNLRRRFTRCEKNTDVQGISAGWADVYRRGVPCQFIALEDPDQEINVPDGEYVLEVTTNATRIFEEENNDNTAYDDNTIWIDLEIRNGTDLLNVRQRKRK